MAATPLRIVQISDTHRYSSPDKSRLGVKTEYRFAARLTRVIHEKNLG